MEQTSLRLSNEELMFQELLIKMGESSFVEKFAEDPEEAFKESDLKITLAEFTDILSRNPALYNSIIEKISRFIDVSHLAYSGTSACR